MEPPDPPFPSSASSASPPSPPSPLALVSTASAGPARPPPSSGFHSATGWSRRPTTSPATARFWARKPSTSTSHGRPGSVQYPSARFCRLTRNSQRCTSPRSSAAFSASPSRYAANRAFRPYEPGAASDRERPPPL